MTSTIADPDRETSADADAAAEKARTVEKRRRRWGCLLYAELAILIPTLVLFCVWLWFHAADRRLAEEALARARAAGDPLTTAEMQALFYPPSPEIDEATERWKSALGLTQEAKKKTLASEVPWFGPYRAVEVERNENGLYTGRTLDQVEQFLEGPGEEAIRAAHEARRAGSVARFVTDVSTNEPTTDPEAEHYFREVWYLLALDMERAAARGDLNAATENLLSMVSVAEAFADDPTVTGMDLHVALYGMSFSQARELIDRVHLSDEQLQRIDAAFAKPDFHRGLVRIVQADQYRVVRAYETDEPTDDEDLTIARWLPLRGADEALAIELFEDLLDEARIDLPSAAKASDRLIARLRGYDDASKFQQFRYAIALLASWQLHRYVNCAMRAASQQTLMRAGIACERYRLQHDSWPESLEELLPEFLAEVPLDLYDGGKVRLETQSDRLALHSIGQLDGMYQTVEFDDGPLTFVIEKPQRR